MRKYLVCKIEEKTWSAPTSSDSVELLVLSFCLLEKLIAAPLTMDIMDAMCPRQLSRMAWEALTHHRMVARLSTERLSFMWRVLWRYRTTHLRLPQLSLSRLFTRIMMKETAICKSMRWLNGRAAISIYMADTRVYHHRRRRGCLKNEKPY